MEEKKRKSSYNEKHNQYTQEYIRQNYKQLSIRLPKEGPLTRETIQEAAAAAGESVNGYILEAVRERMEKERTRERETKKSTKDCSH